MMDALAAKLAARAKVMSGKGEVEELRLSSRSLRLRKFFSLSGPFIHFYFSLFFPSGDCLVIFFFSFGLMMS